MGLALLIWVGGGLLKRVYTFFVNEPSLGQKSPILHLPRHMALDLKELCFIVKQVFKKIQLF